jgi:ketosteroid isomerase-like protein
MQTQQLPRLADSYVRAINEHDRAAFHALFAEQAVVDDAGRVFRGRDAIRDWSNRDIFDAQVTLDVRGASAAEGDTTITTKVEGNFDRTGLPDPVIISHHIQEEGNMIVQLTCRLVT